MGIIKRKTISSTKPDILVEVDGDNFIVTTITIKTIVEKFRLGEVYESDPGTGRYLVATLAEVRTDLAINILYRICKYVTVREEDKLIHTEMDDPTAITARKFTDTHLEMTMTTKVQKIQ